MVSMWRKFDKLFAYLALMSYVSLTCAFCRTQYFSNYAYFFILVIPMSRKYVIKIWHLFSQLLLKHERYFFPRCAFKLHFCVITFTTFPKTKFFHYIFTFFAFSTPFTLNFFTKLLHYYLILGIPYLLILNSVRWMTMNVGSAGPIFRVLWFFSNLSPNLDFWIQFIRRANIFSKQKYVFFNRNSFFFFRTQIDPIVTNMALILHESNQYIFYFWNCGCNFILFFNFCLHRFIQSEIWNVVWCWNIVSCYYFKHQINQLRKKN